MVGSLLFGNSVKLCLTLWGNDMSVEMLISEKIHHGSCAAEALTFIGFQQKALKSTLNRSWGPLKGLSRAFRGHSRLSKPTRLFRAGASEGPG